MGLGTRPSCSPTVLSACTHRTLAVPDPMQHDMRFGIRLGSREIVSLQIGFHMLHACTL